MLEEARNQKLIKRIDKLLEKNEIAEDMSYTVQDKDGVYQCVISYQKNGKWDLFWASTGYKCERGNQRNAKKKAEEITEIFKEQVKNYNKNKKEVSSGNISLEDFQRMTQLNTTNFNPNKTTKADWDFYQYMEHWLYKIKKKQVEPDTFDGYERNVTGWMKKYFTMEEHQKLVKELTAEDLDEFYDYLREECNLVNASVDHYNDNISNAFKCLLKKKIVRYNPSDYIEPIVVDVVEVATYTKKEILQLFDVIEGDIIEIPTLVDGYYGLRRSEIIGLRKEAFDFEEDFFIVNHVALQRDGKKHKEKVYFRDKTKSKKGYRSFPLFPKLKEAIIKRFEQIEENKKLLGDAYNHEYDGYLCVRDNGDIMQPSFFTKRFARIIKNNGLRKITPHGLRHSLATLLHLEGVDIRDLQDWLGHESITSTNRYTRSDHQKQVATGATVKEIFGDNNKQKNNKSKRFIVKKKNIHTVA